MGGGGGGGTADTVIAFAYTCESIESLMEQQAATFALSQRQVIRKNSS